MEPAVARAPATIVCTGTYWRNAWKYAARTYRHFGWDGGTLLANMLAVAAAPGVPAGNVRGGGGAAGDRGFVLDKRRGRSFGAWSLWGTSEGALPDPPERPGRGLGEGR